MKRAANAVGILAGGAALLAVGAGVGAALDYTPHGTQPGLVHALIDSDNCRNCHRDTGTSAFFPWDTWAGTMMANATRDPVFWAALDVANHDQPGVGDYCLRCHAPQAWYGGRVVKTGSGTVDGSNGCRLAGTYTSGDSGDYGGETCHYCHRLMPNGPNGEAAYPGNAAAWLDDGDCNGQGEPCRRGPYNYTNGSPLAPNHVWAYSGYHTRSDVCGTCHDVSSPDTSAGPLKTLIDATGRDTGIAFPIERTFREWQQSDYADVVFRDRFGDAFAFQPALAHGRVCQDCHMPQSADASARACKSNPSGSRAGDLATHGFVGGNVWVPGILVGEYGAALGRGAAYAAIQTAAQQMLAGAAALDITLTAFTPPTASTAGAVAFSVRVTNLSGHKLPTGYSEGRRMWLDVQVRDAAGALLAESGAYDATSATLASDLQARVYEVLQGIWDGSAMRCRTTDAGGAPLFHFALNDCIAKDDRIPPLGFSGAADPQTQPVGLAYPASGGRTVNYDEAPYRFAVPAATALPLAVSATLYYQTASREYIEFLRNEAQSNAFPAENDLCSGATPDRPFAVGPQARTRAEYLYELWNDAPGDPQPGYGKSPPQIAGAPATLHVGG